MAWYQLINAKSDSYIADREGEELLRQLGAVLRSTGNPIDAEVFYSRTANGARRYYLSLSPEAVDLADRVLASYDATALAEPPDLTGMEHIRRL